MAAYIAVALAERAAGRALPFAIIDKATGQAIGSTRYVAIEPAHRRVEIGWTWLGRSWQRTAANTEAKYLLLRHAFETLGCIRVELKTDALNERSRAAIRRIGAREEGTLRSHMITASGRIRDTVYYSILDAGVAAGEEGPGVPPVDCFQNCLMIRAPLQVDRNSADAVTFTDGNNGSRIWGSESL